MAIAANLLYILLGVAALALLVPFVLSLRNTKNDDDRWTPDDDAPGPPAD